MNQSNINAICSQVASTIEKKNADYGGAFSEAMRLFQDYAPSKIYEKFKRIHNLSHAPNRVENEGLRDALLDCMGYCALYLDWLDGIHDSTPSSGD